jgi:hypothetical protein
MTVSRTGRRNARLALALVCIANTALLWFFHNRYWFPTDDGFYANIAERLLSGEVLNRNVQDIHPGYVHALHAFAFRIFGIDLLSLRYPLIASAFMQAIIAFALLRQRGLLLGVIASIAATSLGVVQFMSPNGNWYCLSLAVLLAWWLTTMPDGPVRLVGAGFILGTLTWFRHLTGIWVAMALITVVLMERSSDGRGNQLTLVRLQIGIMLVALAGYLYWNPDTEVGGFIFMGAWPLAVLAWMLFNARTRNGDVAAAIGQLLAGSIIASVPQLLYHLVHRSLGDFVHDLVVVAAAETDLDFYGHGWFGMLPLAALYQTVSSFQAVRIVNGLYWMLLPATSALNGMLLLHALRNKVQVKLLALPLIAVFFAMVSVQYEGPLYLYYTVGLSLTSVLWLVPITAPALRTISALAAVGLCVVAVVFHAGQTRERTAAQILGGERVTTFATLVDCDLPRCSLKVSAADASVYGAFVRLIAATTAPGDSILAIPNDAELYFLAQRRNPTRFYNAAHGTASPELRAEATRIVAQTPPRLVIFRPDDKYNTAASHEIMQHVRSRYEHLDTIAGVELYRIRTPTH